MIGVMNRSWLEKSPLPLAWCALLLLIAACLLPAMRVTVMGSAVDFEGWRCMAFAIEGGWSLLTETTPEPAAWLLLVLSGLSNLVFLLAPWLLWRRPARRRVLAGIALAAALGLVLALASPHVLKDLRGVERPGYFIWLLAYATLLLAPSAARRRPD